MKIKLLILSIFISNSCKHKDIASENSDLSNIAGGFLDAIGLNAREQALYNANPAEGRKVIRAAAEAQLASSTLPGAFQGTGDAMRHAEWNRKMCLSIGCAAAKKWADAHEDGGNTIDNQMDYFNNAVGRQIAQGPFGGSGMIVMQYIQEGKLRVIVNGQLVPSR